MACGCQTSLTLTWTFRFFRNIDGVCCYLRGNSILPDLFWEMFGLMWSHEASHLIQRLFNKDQWEGTQKSKQSKHQILPKEGDISLLSLTPPPPSHSSSWPGVCQQWLWEEDGDLVATLTKPHPPFPKPAIQMVILSVDTESVATRDYLKAWKRLSMPQSWSFWCQWSLTQFSCCSPSQYF